MNFTFQTKSHWSLHIHLCKCTCINWDIHLYSCVCRAQTKSHIIHILLNVALYSAPHPHLCPQVHWGREQNGAKPVRWQWHPSHAMNNQWTPSGAYNRGAQLQSFTPGCLSRSLSLSLPPSLCPTHRLSLYFRLCSLALPLFPHILPHSYCLAFSHHLAFFSIYISLPCSAPPAPLAMLLSGLFDRLVMVSLILIQLYNSQAANKVTCCP